MDLQKVLLMNGINGFYLFLEKKQERAKEGEGGEEERRMFQRQQAKAGLDGTLSGISMWPGSEDSGVVFADSGAKKLVLALAVEVVVTVFDGAEEWPAIAVGDCFQWTRVVGIR
ncbi:hypothetical protein L484_024685 [Morus notabilis]|uniref:Uncharacterized protein n=1 Tax=Morus notabilis TaxID=981085 RepID=W9RFA9_9ROSA|nr:hypothetical protein L484_024685 [Morus notabilis]